MRRRKITIQEIPDYYNYRRFRQIEPSVSGYIYYLCDRLSNEERKRLLTQYHNTEIVYGHAQYAHEISYDVLIVYDKCIR